MEPLALFFAARSLGIALREQLVQGIAGPLLWLDDQPPAFDRDADRGSCLQVQDVEQSGRDGQHDRAADLAQIGCVHAVSQSYTLI
jgi:hypothetical protein